MDTELKCVGFGSRVRRIRKEIKISQKDFAAKIGASPSYISEIEAGNINPGQQFMLKIYVAFNVNTNWLLTGKGRMFVDTGSLQLNHFDFGEQTKDIMHMLKLFKVSPLVKITIMAFANHFILANEDIIEKDIQKNKILQKGVGNDDWK